MVRQALRIHIQPRGLRNKRNDCFFNSAMQCLLGIPQLNYFYLNTKFLPSQPVSIAFCNFLQKFVPNEITNEDNNNNHINNNPNNINHNNNTSISSPIDPTELISILRPKTRLFDGNEQDTHEFLFFFLDILCTELGDTNSSSLTDLDSYEKLVTKNIIIRIFYGMMNITLTCLSCRNVKSQFESFASLILNVNSDLEESLEEFFKSEKLGDRLTCDNCKIMTEAVRSFELHTLPEVLIIQLKRFWGVRSKDTRGVQFSKKLKIMNLSYRLIGYICHMGTLKGGHYVAYAERNRNWYCFDDSNVVKVSENECRDDAYILFYSRI
ncbi:Ubiquitin carboxyl-terminal hydrolase Usp2 [Dictyocoela muelleri]|nr:Ubiquitin carboxyl-terminal hydrolase Usp2 [Dictyocoela muelleri]